MVLCPMIRIKNVFNSNKIKFYYCIVAASRNTEENVQINDTPQSNGPDLV
jgi:hypothetical protein